MSGLTYDLLDRGAIFGARENGGVRIFPPQISLVLNALGGGERSARTPPIGSIGRNPGHTDGDRCH